MSARDTGIGALLGVAALILMSACSLLAPQSAAVVAQTAAAKMPATAAPEVELPTWTPTAAATATPAGPTVTQSEIDNSMVQLQRGTPVPEWRGVPVMPGAFDGSDMQSLYTYRTMTPPAEVAAWYRKTLDQLGWQPSWGDATGSAAGGEIIMYEKGSKKAFILAMLQEGQTIVSLDITGGE